MVSRISPSSKSVFEVIREIIEMGEVEIPKQFQGTGAPGDTLEYLCNIERNNRDSPDLKDWEVKFHGGGALLTLFHKDPEPRGILNKVVDTFGWETSKGQISFRHTLSGKSERGFITINKDNRILIENKKNLEIMPFWEYNTLLNAGGSKLRRLILVNGKVNKPKRTVIFKAATAFWDLKNIICLQYLFNLQPAPDDGVLLSGSRSPRRQKAV